MFGRTSVHVFKLGGLLMPRRGAQCGARPTCRLTADGGGTTNYTGLPGAEFKSLTPDWRSRGRNGMGVLGTGHDSRGKG